MQTPGPIDSEFINFLAEDRSRFKRDIEEEMNRLDAEHSLVVSFTYFLASIGAICAAYFSYNMRPVSALTWASLPMICVPLAHFIKTESLSLPTAKFIIGALALAALAETIFGWVTALFLVG